MRSHSRTSSSRRPLSRALLALLVLVAAVPLAAAPARATWPNDPTVNVRIPLDLDPGSHRQTWPISACPDSGGGAIVLSRIYWSESSGSVYAVQRVDAFGQARWGDGSILLNDGGQESFTPPVSDGAGGAFIGYGSMYSLRLFHVTGAGATYADLIPFPAMLSQIPEPVLVSDGVGGVVLAWYEYRSTPTRQGYWAQRFSSSGVPQWTTGGVRMNTTNLLYGHHWMSPDGAGGAILFACVTGTGTGKDIRAFSVNGSGVLRTPAAGSVVCDAPGDQTFTSYLGYTYPGWVAPASPGSAIGTWIDYRSDAAGDLYAQRVDTLGVAQWAANGVPVSTLAGAATSPTITSDGHGGAIVAWLESTRSVDGAADIYAQRLAPDGAAAWTPNGIPVCDAPRGQWAPVLTTPAAGGAIVAWTDPRDSVGSARDIYAQALDGVGTPLWGTNGTPVSTAPRDQVNPVMVPVGDHAAIVAWGDYREYQTDIGYVEAGYAQYLPLAEGALLGIEPPPSAAPPARLLVAPNPALASARVAFTRGASAHAALELLDIAGRVVRMRDLSALAPGAREVMLDDLGALPAGLYLVRVKQGERTDTARLLVTH